MKYLFCVLLALSLAACGKETEDPGLSREEFLDFFPLHEHGEVYVEPFYVRFYYPGGNCLLFPTDILGESPAPPVQYMFLHLDGSDVPPAELIDRAYGVDCAAATTALSFLPDAAGGNYLVADFRYRYAAEQGTQIGERVGEWRIVWGVQPQYCIDMLNWMIHCWGIVPLTDMLSLVNTRMIADVDTPENREQAFYDMAWLNENMIMRNRTHGGYKVLVDDLWEFCETLHADMVIMWEHMSCKALVGMHGQFEEQARARGIHLVWVCHDLCDPRVYTRQAIRDQLNAYMRTVMREEPIDPTIEILPDEHAW